MKCNWKKVNLISFKEFIETIVTLKNYEVINGALNLVVVNCDDQILYNKNGNRLSFDLKKTIKMNKGSYQHHIDIDEQGNYYICYPVIHKTEDIFKVSGYILVAGIKVKADIGSLLISCELIARLIEISIVYKVGTPLCIDNAWNEELLQLTERELQITQLIIGGATDSQVGYKLSISKPTLRVYIKSIFNKTNTSSRAQLINYYFSQKCLYLQNHALFFTFDSS